MIRAAAAGDSRAAHDLIPFVYEELRRLAHSRLGEQPAGQNTLQATALVHEAYAKLVSGQQEDWQSRRHFFNAAALAMRQILVDRARRRMAEKHGGARKRVALSDSLVIPASGAHEDEADWIGLDAALARLQVEDAELAEVVNLRFFAGLSVDETAAALGVSDRTVDRRWKLARAWLLHALSEGLSEGQA